MAQQHRRDFIAKFILHNSPTTSRRLKKELTRAGFAVSHSTVNTDLNALGYDALSATRRKAGRPKRNPNTDEAPTLPCHDVLEEDI